MAIVKYKDCSGADKSVDKQSTFEICSTDIGSFQYDKSLWRVEEIGSCAEVKSSCTKYKVVTRGGKLIPAKIFYIDCNGNPIIDTLRAKGGYSVEVCASEKPVYIDKTNKEVIASTIRTLPIVSSGNANPNPLLSILLNSLFDSRAPIIEPIGDCSTPPITLEPDDSNNYSVSISHNIPNRIFNISFNSGEIFSIGLNSPYEDFGTSNVAVPEFEYSLGDVITMSNENGDDEQYILTDVRESSPTGDVRLSNIGQRTSDFESVGRSVASNIEYVFFFEKVDGDLTDEEPINPDLNSGDNGNTSNVRGDGVRTNTEDTGGTPTGGGVRTGLRPG